MTLSVFSRRAAMRFFVASGLVLGLGALPGPGSPASNASVTASGLVAAGVDASQPAGSTPSATQDQTSVTLITGDTVTLDQAAGTEPTVLFEPAGGQASGSDFSVRRDDGRVTVIPDDVAGLVPSVLDPALFDVTGLVEMRYDDQATDQLPLIVERAPGVRTLAAASDSLATEHVLSSIRATAAELDKSAAADFGRELSAANSVSRQQGIQTLGGIRHVWLDSRVEASALDGYLTQIKAQAAFDSGLTGTGVKVAVLDTGVDAGHPALDGQVDDQANFTDGPSSDDGNGHGTHVASLVAGTGALSGGARQGIAPGVDLISGKVLADDSFGQESWVIEGMEWAVAHNADVVNLSLGGPPGNSDQPIVSSLDALTANSGALFVVAAGNRGGFGPSPGTIDAPGTAASALTVGAVGSNDAIAAFSSEGPTQGNYRLKPDITAPGVNILGAKAGARSGDVYRTFSGTSQATPIVAGSAALLMQAHPDWTWQQVKTELVGTADPYQFQTAYTHGGGRLDLAQATSQLVTGDLATIDFGYLKHPDDAVHAKTLTLTNDGDAPVAVTIADQEKKDVLANATVAPDAAVTATPSTLTIPAHGQASTAISLDPSLVEDAVWQGRMTISSGSTSLLNLPVGWYDEPERYDVNVHVIDRNGDPFSGGQVQMQSGSGLGFANINLDENGDGGARLPAGYYSAFSRIITPPGSAPTETFTIAGSAEVNVTHDTSLTIDARDAKRLRAPTIDHTATHVVQTSLSFARHSVTRQGYIDFAGFTPQDIEQGRVFITPTKPVKHGQFEAALRWRLEPDHRRGPANPSAYELLLTTDTFTDPLSPRLDKQDVKGMARLDDRLNAVSEPGATDSGLAWTTDESGIALILWRPIDVPQHRVELLSADSDVSWRRCLSVPSPGTADMCDPTYHSFAKGADVRTTWSAGIHPHIVGSTHSPTTMFIEGGLSDGPHVGKLDFNSVDEASLTLSRNGELVATKPALFGFFTVPNAPGDFELEQSMQLKPTTLPVSRSATTTWAFHSAPPADPTQQGATTPPLLTLDYGPDVDELGLATAKRPLRLALSVGHLAGTAAPAAITDASLSYSKDGGDTWTSLKVKRTHDGTFDATIPGPDLRSGDSISLRARAADEVGGSIDQTVLGMISVVARGR